jgi:hypothetical protein
LKKEGFFNFQIRKDHMIPMPFLFLFFSFLFLLVQKEPQKGHFFVRCFPCAGAYGNRLRGLDAVQGFPRSSRPRSLHHRKRNPSGNLSSIKTGLFFFLLEIKGFSLGFQEAIHRAFRVSEAAWMVRPRKARRFQEKKNQPSVFCFFFWR